jgi:hypothetical protein
MKDKNPGIVHYGRKRTGMKRAGGASRGRGRIFESTDEFTARAACLSLYVFAGLDQTESTRVLKPQGIRSGQAGVESIWKHSLINNTREHGPANCREQDSRSGKV